MGAAQAPEYPVFAAEQEDGIYIDNGMVSCQIGTGETIIRALSCAGMKPLQGRLCAYLERRSAHIGLETAQVYQMVGRAEKITLEQAGPVLP